jgi:hypothetical protein
MKKLIILIIPILLLCGCSIDESASYWTYCDKKYGVEYIRYGMGYQGGITVRLDENGNVIHCK